MRFIALISLAGVVATACTSIPQTDRNPSVDNEPMPPVAERRDHTLTAHDHTRNDPYYWMRDDKREDPDVLAYLERENDYTEVVLAPTGDLQERFYQEMVSRLKPDDASVPYRKGDYFYYRRYEEGKDHPIYARRKGSEDAAEEILFDENAMAEGYDYYRIGNYEVSPDQQWAAFAADKVSRRNYDIQFKNLKTGEFSPETIVHASTSLAWAADSKHLFYVKREQGTLIANEVWRHRLGTDAADDVLVFKENDSQYVMFVYPSRDERFIVVGLSSTLQTEYRLIPVDQPLAEPQPFLARQDNHEYQIETAGDVTYIRTNWDAANFRIMKVATAHGHDRGRWTEVVANRPTVFVNNFTVLDDYLVVEETESGINQLQVIPLNGGESFYVSSDEPAYTAAIDNNPNMDTPVLRYSYSSLTTPRSIYDLNLRTGERVLRKRQFAGHDFDPESYETAREYLTARDGERVPVTLLYRKGTEADGTHPLYLLGYGSYGSWYEPSFRSSILSLVDRGFVFATAHIRGGQEMGRRWYEDGKLLHKKNTFTDFIDTADYLVERGWAAKGKVVGMGRSAGGLLIGAVANMAPQSFGVLMTQVPFVDVVTTMLDESIPLTTFEYDEWGNPNDKTYYDYMLSYSPYDQIKAQDYPHMYVATGLWDSQVQYWEPAKWVAKLRHHKTDNNRLLFYTDMSAGHGGGAGRFDRLRDTAREYAFIFQVLKLEP